MKTKNAADQLSLFFAESVQSTELPTVNVIVQAEDQSFLPEATVVCGNALTIPVEPDVTVPVSVPLSDSIEECEWASFLRHHGRVPMITDAKKPWEYRGWLLYYRLLLEAHPGIAGRWDYWCRTMTANALLPEPIPQLEFSQCADRNVIKTFELWIREIDRYRSGWSAVDALLDWFLWGFGTAKAEPQFPDVLNESLYRQVNLGPLLLKPYDYIGEWIAMQKGKWNPNAFYPTPHSIVEFMVKMIIEQSGENGSEDLRRKTCLDPAVGSGRMLLHASNHSLRLYGIDIDPTLVKATYVNGALYAPWILRPFPETFFAPVSSG